MAKRGRPQRMPADAVCVVWNKTVPGSGARIGTLVYGSRGLIRTYLPGAIDERATRPDGTLDVVTDRDEIQRRLADGYGKRAAESSFAVPVTVAAKMFGWPLTDFDVP